MSAKKKNNFWREEVATKKEQIIVAYVPVLHEGYRRLFEKYPAADTLYILGEDITKEYVPLAKDIRALPAEMIRKSILAWKRFKAVKILGKDDWKVFKRGSSEIVMPDDDVMRDLKEKNIPEMKITWDTAFLRWDKHKIMEGKPVAADQKISAKDSDIMIISLLRKEAEKSSDVWRRIAAAVVKEGKIVLIRHNHAVPSEFMPYMEGDPRSEFHKGVNIELSTSFHTEAGLIADAARLGISLEGAEMYVTTFPCPPCAKLVAYSGIKKLYYADGYGVLDGERLLKSRGVEIIFVDTSGK